MRRIYGKLHGGVFAPLCGAFVKKAFFRENLKLHIFFGAGQNIAKRIFFEKVVI